MPETIIDINNLAHLHAELEKLGPVPEGYKRLYRGQNADYGENMIPSLFRSGELYNLTDHAWKLAGQQVVKKLILGRERQTGSRVNTAADSFPLEGLVQHYGLRSGGLDLTDELPVALWFGLSKRREESVVEEVADPQGTVRSIRFRKAYYESLQAPFAYLYIFECPVWQHTSDPRIGDCVSLQQWFGKYTSRPARQHAWYAYSDNHSVEQGNLYGFIKRTYRVSASVLQESGPYREAMYYFPEPGDDTVYKSLLHACCMRNSGGIYERLLDIPQYYNSPAEFPVAVDAWGYTGYLRFDEMRYYFDTVKKKYPDAFRRRVASCGEESWWLKEANPLHLVVPDWHIIVTVKDVQGKIYECKLEDVRGPFAGIRRNYLIELSPYEQVVNQDPDDSKVRGVWLVQAGDIFGLSLFTYDNGEFGGTQLPSWFRYKDGAGIEYIPRAGAPEYDAGMLNILKGSLTNALRALQIYERIPYFPDLVPPAFVYGKKQSAF